VAVPLVSSGLKNISSRIKKTINSVDLILGLLSDFTRDSSGISRQHETQVRIDFKLEEEARVKKIYQPTIRLILFPDRNWLRLLQILIR
jgi:hypothetical protein